MAFDRSECVEMSALPEKITAIIPTAAGPMECLLWSVFSLLLRSKPNDLIEHFVVCINGPDSRTGDETNCDIKQEFLEELRDMQWYHTDAPDTKKDMPITVIRAWSRIGHPEAVEMAIPWVHTDAYLLMHDDIIITKHSWLKEVREKFCHDPDVAIAFSPRLLCAQCDSSTYHDKPILRMPHLLCAFLVCRRKWVEQTGTTWCGWHIPTPPFKLHERVGNVEEFLNYYRKLNALDNPPDLNATYEYATMEMGAWLYYCLCQDGRKFAQLDPKLIHHFGTMSWDSESGKMNRILGNTYFAKSIEKDILDHPDYGPLYQKYINKSRFYKLN